MLLHIVRQLSLELKY